MRWDRPHPMARREDGGRGKMRKKKKIPKTGIMLKQVPWPDTVALCVGLI